MTDYLIAAAIIAASAAGGYAGLMHKKASNIEVEDEQYHTFEEVLEGVKLYIVEQSKDDNISADMSDAEMEKEDSVRLPLKIILRWHQTGCGNQSSL